MKINKINPWYKYLLPKRLTLQSNPPIYQWLCFVWGKEEQKQETPLLNWPLERNGVIMRNLEGCLKEANPNPMYYAGGTLCIDIKDHGRQYVVMLNLNGKMSVLECGVAGSSQSFQQPQEMLEATRKVYLHAKGETEYFRKELGLIAKDMWEGSCVSQK